MSALEYDAKNRNRVLLIIIDGYGYDPEKEQAILNSVEEKLPREVRQLILEQARKRLIDTGQLQSSEALRPLVQATICPTPIRLITSEPTFSQGSQDKLIAVAELIKTDLCTHKIDGVSVADFIQDLIIKESVKQRYAIWAARTPLLHSLRRLYPTVSTKTSGIAVGYEDLRPEVQGNSETGHQQIGSFVVAVQPAFNISLSIQNGEFFENPVLRECVATACETNANLNLCFLLSGEYGNDGRVHSCWNHLEAFLKLCFEEFRLDPIKLRIQAILDGRDSPLFSSVETKDNQGGFLQKLAALLHKYGADDALAWIIGRSIAMDRDYDEEKAIANYELLTKGKGQQAQGIGSAIELVRQMHANGFADAYVPPIAVCDRDGKPRTVASGDVFVDLNFRSDRQRALIASLLGAKDFLAEEARRKSANWNLDWIDPNLKLKVTCLTEYHPDFSLKYGAKIAFQTSPNPHSFLSILAKASKELNFPFKYFLLAESTKALHVGYFIRGQREEIEVPECEDRTIVPSYGIERGVKTDDDYYKTPEMKVFEICGILGSEIYRRRYDLMIVNLSNADMLGHLICDHFEEAVESIEVIDDALRSIIPSAQKLGFYTIITSDHGNADDYSPAHGSHDILTTIVSPNNDVVLRNNLNRKARLSDLPWTIIDLMGIRQVIASRIPEIPSVLIEQDLVGQSLIVPRE